MSLLPLCVTGRCSRTASTRTTGKRCGSGCSVWRRREPRPPWCVRSARDRESGGTCPARTVSAGRPDVERAASVGGPWSAAIGGPVRRRRGSP
uniref:Uncharacterized protein n=1 Tax=uncultured marine virus TaxID=186617 RepID=A0A0F7L5N9_9VIRU|nr:hypothetical protein [uncultured marine virus]